MESRVLRTKSYYDGIAKGYSELYHKEQQQKISKIIEYLPKEGLVLDVGSGDGVLNSFLDNNVKLISLDLSEELIKLNPSKRKLVGSVMSLPFEKNTFDFICSFTMIQDTPDVEISINEIHRVLKNKGRLIISFLKMSSKKDQIINKIKGLFNIKKSIEEEKDVILVVEKK